MFSPIVSIATAIVGVAIIALIVSKNSNTAAVLRSAGSAFAEPLSVALSPVTGTTPYGSGSGGSPFSINSNLGGSFNGFNMG